MSRVGETASASFNFSESAQLEHRSHASIEQRRSNNSKFEEKTDKGNNGQCKYIPRNVSDVHKYLQIHICIITTVPNIIHAINLRCKSCYLSKLCATKDLTTQIGFSPCLATNALKKRIEVCLWKPTYVQLSTRGRLHRANLGWKKLWLNTCWLLHFFQWNPFELEELGAWVTQWTSQWTSPPQFALVYISSFLLETVKWKKQGQPQNESQNKWKLLSYLTHFQVHMLMIHLQWSMQLVHVTCACSFDSGWDTLLARNACSYMEKHLSTAVMSASSILLVYLSFYPNPTSHPSAKLICLKILHLLKWLQLTAQLYFVAAAMDYRRLSMANTSEMNKWSSVSRNDKIQKLREAKGPTLSQNWYHVHQFTLMINWTLFQYQTRHDDLIGFWWSFEAGNAFESKLSVSARNGEQSFWIWSPHNRERLGQNPASTGREPPFYADRTHGRWRSYLVSYGIVGPFRFPPAVWRFCTPRGKNKIG